MATIISTKTSGVGGLEVTGDATGILQLASNNGTTGAELDASQNLKFNSGYGSVATAYGCRAWVNFNGNGTVAVIASGNVSSITDGGVGVYTINFATALADNKYSIVSSASNNAATVNIAMTTSAGAQKSTTASLITTFSPASLAVDPFEVNIAVFR